ncbi:unnamed protein product [Rodentolepis nana]|uniref:Coiled-coil domain-containing protein 170 n=1 Tax=Rodentolepis nana TaxID=102285 RepID=A0A0R3TZ57_RODNA|nr:unnamed protein product [Rodentolepis nana]
MADQDICSNSNNSEEINAPHNKSTQSSTSDSPINSYHYMKISQCCGDINDSGLGSSRITTQNRNSIEDQALHTAKVDLNPRLGLMFHELSGFKTVVSEVKACERELSDVEAKLLDLTEEIRSREAKIIDLEDEISELQETKFELEAENHKIRSSFKECLKKSTSNTNDKLTTKIENLENELEHLQFSYAEEINGLMDREDFRSKVYVNIVKELEVKLKDLRAISKSQKEQLLDSMRQNRKLETDKAYLEELARNSRKRIEDLREKVQEKMAKIVENEKELNSTSRRLSAIEKRCTELEIERNLLREQRAISEERLKCMNSDIVDMRSALQSANCKISTLENKLGEKERLQTIFESLFHRAENDSRATRDFAAHLEDDKRTLLANNLRMESAIHELRSTCTNAEQEVSKANEEIRRMKSSIAKYVKDKRTTEIAIYECLQNAGIFPEKLVVNRRSSKCHQIILGLDAHRSLQLLSEKIANLVGENEKLKNHLATQQLKILEECSKNAAHVNANFNQLGAKLQSAREDNKQLCIQQILLRHQLETRKFAMEKCTEVKRELQEKLNAFEPPIKCDSSGPVKPVRNPELCNQLTRFFEERAKSADPDTFSINHNESIRSIACKINKLEKTLKDDCQS